MDSDAWATIERLATEEGVTAETIRKWRSRGVAHQWRLPLIEKAQAEGITLRPGDFERRRAA